MLKWLFCSAVALLMPLLALAQLQRTYSRPVPAWEILLKGGWQYSTFTSNKLSAAYASGWLAGVALKAPLKGRWWLQPEIMYNRRRASLEFMANGGAQEAVYSFSYVSYPVLLVYRPNDVFDLQAGPQLGVLLGNEVQSDMSRGNITPADLNKWDYGLAAGVEFNISPLAVGLRYQHSFARLATTEHAKQQLGDSRLHGLQLYGALVF